MLQSEEQENILKYFPNIEMCFETIIHNTFPAQEHDYVIAIPEGKKYFAWFTTYKNQHVCFLLEISKNKQICNIEIIYTSFHTQLAYETILYGTKFMIGGKHYFSCEDIYYYKGKNVTTYSYINKLALFKNIFKNEINQVSYCNSMILFGLPLISTDLEELQKRVNRLPYNIKHVQYKKETSNKNRVYQQQPLMQSQSMQSQSKQQPLMQFPLPKQQHHSKQSQYLENVRPKYTKNEKIFKVKADIQNDIYNLYSVDNDIFIGIAYIPDYKTSVLMNKLFRNIKENQNLDALEESDDDEEFENDKVDKYVYLDRTYSMKCEYNTKYKKWQPITVMPSF